MFMSSSSISTLIASHIMVVYTIAISHHRVERRDERTKYQCFAFPS